MFIWQLNWSHHLQFNCFKFNPPFILYFLKDIFFFVKNGYIQNFKDESNNFKFFKVMFCSLFLVFCCTLFFNSIVYSLLQVLKIEIYKTSHFFRKETISSLLYVVVAIPIIEELCFRYPLKKTKYGISLFVSYTFYLFFGNIVGFKYDNPYVLLIAIFVLT